MSHDSRRVPALVISGFLGSGKTTLVQHLLREAQRSGERVALVSNELGELGVDRALLGGGGEAFVELEGGCVCCELSDDLVNTLQMLRDRVDPDRVIVETSGVALPFDTQLNFWRDPVRDWIGDDMAVVVVNAEQVAEGRDLEGTFQDQLSSADWIVLNKIDLVPAEQLPVLEAKLRSLEPEAPLLRCVRGCIDAALFFPPEAGSLDRRGRPPSAPAHDHEQFETDELRVAAGLSELEIEALLEEPRLLRAKGFVQTDRALRLVQRVGRRVEWCDPGVNPAPETIGRIVRIRRATQGLGTARKR